MRVVLTRLFEQVVKDTSSIEDIKYRTIPLILKAPMHEYLLDICSSHNYPIDLFLTCMLTLTISKSPQIVVSYLITLCHCTECNTQNKLHLIALFEFT